MFRCSSQTRRPARRGVCPIQGVTLITSGPRAGAAFTPGKSKAFTLIELLVVIAVVAILAAILFPEVAATRPERTRLLSG